MNENSKSGTEIKDDPELRTSPEKAVEEVERPVRGSWNISQR